MKRLFISIEDVHIKGGVEQLSDVVRSIDNSLQIIAQDTEKLTHYLMTYSSSNKGNQYEKTVNSSLQLREEVCEVSMDINALQNQIVDYQNKIYRYEDMSSSAPIPNAYQVITKPISENKSEIQFNRDEMIKVVSELRNYSEVVFFQIKSINKKKNDIASVWLDSQYDVFSETIDEITGSVINAIKVYEEYVVYLEEKIKELG